MRILHVLRAPLGGLFRHVCDLAKGQTVLGHDVGLICDATTGGANADTALANMAPYFKLGVTRMSIAMRPSLGDMSCIRQTRKLANDLNVDVLHGHGAKGGLYARLAAKSAKLGAIYSPHGGSLHYQWKSPVGFLYLATETWLRRKTSGFSFVCAFERNTFDEKIGTGTIPSKVTYNGLWKEEFHHVPPAANAADILFVGEMRHLKGYDLLLQAIASLSPKIRLTAVMVGDGPELQDAKVLAKELGIDAHVRFTGRLGIVQALPLGKLLVFPSRAESFPYVVLEVIAASRPMIAANVGGLKEVLPSQLLFEPDNVAALADKLEDVIKNANKYQTVTDALALQSLEKFSAESMVKGITDFYSNLK